MFKNLKFFILLVIIFFVISGIFYWRGINSPVDKNGADINFIISSGEGVKQIGQNLADNGLINSKFYFKIYVWRAKKESNLQAGEYVLNSAFTIKEIVDIFVFGKIINKEKTITIIEGWNIKDIGKYFYDNKIVNKDEFIKLAKAGISGNEFLNDAPKEATLEGYLFPDTYRISNDSSSEDIINKMLDNFDKKLTEKMRDDIEKQDKTIFEIITMASVVEKEVMTQEDMNIVAGIFFNRMEIGQPLESCATLAYILGVNKPIYSLEDTKIDSPYNTYQNAGLPPGPISNPGLNAIKATIYPTDTDYLYFLSNPDTRETIFSKTYNEHLTNKEKYLR